MEKLIEEVQHYLSENNNLIVSKDKVHVRKRGDFIMIDYLLEEREEEKYELHEESLGIEVFLKAYNIGSLQDLQSLSSSQMWKRYQAEGAEVMFTNCDGVRVEFRTVEGKTKVFCYEQDYNAEVDKVFDRLEQFKSFVDEHKDLIGGQSYKRG